MRFNPFYKHPPLRCYPSVGRVKEATILEIGPGRGDFLFERARDNPEAIVAAVEIKRKRYEKLKPRIKRLGIENVCLIHGDARVALPVLFRPQQFEVGYILFSDPWPKDRHEKHRLFQPYFVHELSRIIKPGGEIVVAHDDEGYFSEIDRLFKMHPAFARPEDVGVVRERPLLFETFYAAKWQKEGRTLQASRYIVNDLSESEMKRRATDSGWADFAGWHERTEIVSD